MNWTYLYFPPLIITHENLSVNEIFEIFIYNTIIQLLIDETYNYSQLKNSHLTANEVRCFIQILCLTGYNPLPSKIHYWDCMSDMKNEAVSNAMKHDPFFKICNFN